MLECVITSSVLILALSALRRVLRGRINPRLMYGLWLLAALRLLLPFSLFESPVSVLAVLPEPTAAVDVEVEAVLREDPEEAGQISAVQRRPEGDVLSGSGGAAPPIPVGTAPAPENSAGPAEASAIPWTELLRGVWLVGAGMVLLWFLLVNLRLKRTLRRARRVEVPCPLPVYVSRELPSPCLAGLLRPAIYLTPSCLEHPDRLRHVLAHEMTHYRQGDPLWAWVRCLCLAFYWFDPLVWLAAALSRRDCELSCDAGAIARLGEPERLSYGRTLLDLVTPAPAPGQLLQTATTMAARPGALRERIALIAKKPRMLAVTLAVVVLAVLAVLAATFTSAPADRRTLEERLQDPPGALSEVLLEYNLSEDTLLAAYYAPCYDPETGNGYLCSLFALDPAQFEREYDEWEMTGGRTYLGAGPDGRYYVLQTTTDVRYPPEYAEGYLAARDTLLSWVAQAVADSPGTVPLEEDGRWNAFQGVCTFPGEHRLATVELSNGYRYYFVLSQPADQGEHGIWCVDRWIDYQGNNRIAHPAEAYSVTLEEYYAQRQAEDFEAWSDPEAVLLAYLNETFGWQYVRPTSIESMDEAGISALTEQLRSGLASDEPENDAVAAALAGRTDWSLTLTPDGGERVTRAVGTSIQNGALESLTSGYDWYPMAGGYLPSGAYTLSLSDGDGLSLTCVQGSPVAQLTVDGVTTYYQVESTYPSDGDTGLVGALRAWYDELEFDLSAVTIPTVEGEEPAATAQRFGEATAEHLRDLTAGSLYAVADAQNNNSAGQEVGGSGDELVLSLSLALRFPEGSDIDRSPYQAGAGLAPLSGERAGWYGWGRQVLLVREGGAWRIQEMGTGGVTLDGYSTLSLALDGEEARTITIADDGALWDAVQAALSTPAPSGTAIPDAGGEFWTLHAYGRRGTQAGPWVRVWPEEELAYVSDSGALYAVPGLEEELRAVFDPLELEEAMRFSFSLEPYSAQAVAQRWAEIWFSILGGLTPGNCYRQDYHDGYTLSGCTVTDERSGAISFAIHLTGPQGRSRTVDAELTLQDGAWQGRAQLE